MKSKLNITYIRFHTFVLISIYNCENTIVTWSKADLLVSFMWYAFPCFIENVTDKLRTFAWCNMDWFEFDFDWQSISGFFLGQESKHDVVPIINQDSIAFLLKTKLPKFIVVFFACASYASCIDWYFFHLKQKVSINCGQYFKVDKLKNGQNWKNVD